VKLAAVTMVYNEPDYMDLWCRHYARQVGEENCYVIDHGSDDGTTDALGAVNVIRIPRSPMDDEVRAKLVSDFCSLLFSRYDAVAHVDIDELLVPDPRYHRHLQDCAVAMTGPVMHAVGLEVWHRAETEAPIDIMKPISLQRGWTWFNSALCKPAMIREPVKWSPGFHSVDAPLALDRLFLFHLRYFDVGRGLRRLAHTRSMAWASETAGSHQRQPDETWLKLVTDVARLQQSTGADLDAGTEPMASLLRALVESQKGREADTYKIDLGIHGGSLLPIPLRFKGRF
jgi:hypothetical protein